MTGAPLMAEMTWPEIDAAARAGAVALWSVGSTEQHGPHLPVSVDHLLPVELSKRIAQRVHCVIPPPQQFGNRSHPLSGGGQGFPATTSLRAGTLIQVIRDVVAELARTGFTRIALINWHAENVNLLYEGVELARELGGMDDVTVMVIDRVWASFGEGELDFLFADAEGFPGWAAEHAAIVETSLMQALRPDLVRHDLIADDQSAERPFYELLPAPPSHIALSGVLAPATKASVEKGERLAGMLVDNLAAGLVEGLGAPLVSPASEATCDRLHCLLLGWESAPEWVSLEGGSRAIRRLPIIGILARTPAGWLLLEAGVELAPFAGLPLDTPHPIWRAGLPEQPYDGDSGDPLLTQLERVGVGLDELAGVALSHLHLDHTGGLKHVRERGIPVWIQRRELAFARRPAAPGEEAGRAFYETELDGVDWRLLDGDGEILPGVEAISTPGHAPGHMSYRVRMAESGTWLFAVDAIDLQQGIDQGRPIGSSVAPIDAPLRRLSHERLVTLSVAEGARLVPGHCPDTWPALAADPAGFR
ncbi:MAG TPA: creatininase [Conexibacter sp.]|nr:creatininase [Conexibacter sp.]